MTGVMDNSIRIKELNMVYTGLADDDGTGLGVLSNVNLKVQANEFVSILGPSGCGKSTLLKIIAGLEKDYEGEIYLGNDNPKYKRVPVCYMLQKDCLMPWRSLLSNVLLPIEIKKGDLKGKGRDSTTYFRFGWAENYRPRQSGYGKSGIIKHILWMAK